MAARKNISSGTHWEEQVGYSRAVRMGNIIEVAGTTALDKERIVAPGDAYAQTVFIIGKIEKALREAGAGLNDVVRTRMYVVDLQWAEQVGRAHAEFFSAIRPASIMIEISALVHPDLLVEMEVSAILADSVPE